MWRTPYTQANPGVTGPFGNGLVGIEGASSIAMIYLRNGKVLFAERPHGDYRMGQANPLLVNVSVLHPLPASVQGSPPLWL